MRSAGRTILAAAVLALLAVGPAAAEFYKWVDKNGVVHFQDTPPPSGVKAQAIDPQPAPSFKPDPVTKGSAPAVAGPNWPKVDLYTTPW